MMLIIPELRTVIITPPRTGSAALRDAVLRNFPRAFTPYRHMEATGVPFGYERWWKYCMVRHPMDRLWSLYKYCQECPSKNPEYRQRMIDSVSCGFETWLTHGSVVFTDPGPKRPGNHYDAHYAVHNYLPEQYKSQELYVQPNTGTIPVSMEDGHIYQTLDIKPERSNESSGSKTIPELSDETKRDFGRRFAWDLQMYDDLSSYL